ncbi:MAG: FliA/WhiG family RNA polymerase sigma factor [Peptococcaceae bacterium]|jgi:RNA polymerase sigma factor for flagellar operon FliA|nr:FliA/WhiG family RNA polymerase sigma factor [Peptococcaceae bacterium]
MIVAESVWREYYRSRDENLRDELVLAHLNLVKYLAGRLAIRLPAHISQEDLESYGVFGLLEAVEKYNPDLGVSFKSYAYNRIRGAMLDEVRKQNWVSRTTWQRVQRLNTTREKLQKELGVQPTNEVLAAAMKITVPELHKLSAQASMMAVSSLDETVPTSSGETVCLRELIADDAISDPLEIIEGEEDKRLLGQAIGELPDKDLTVLSLYYQEGLTLKEIGKVLDVSESRVCQIHTRALKRLREKLKQSEAN